MRLATYLLLCLVPLGTGCRQRNSPPAERAIPSGEIAPTMVRLDFVDRPVAEVVVALKERSAVSLQLDEDAVRDRQGLARRSVRLKAAEQVPFWEALEQLVRATGLRITTDRGITGPVVLRLIPQRGVRAPVSLTGAFRCELLGLWYRRALPFGGSRVVPSSGFPVPPRRGDDGPDVGPSYESLQVRVQIRPEPRPGMAFVSGGIPRVLEATDDRGRSLMPSGDSVGPQAYLITGGLGALVAVVPLARPEPPGAAIRKLVGVAPMRLHLPRVDVLEFPLAGAAGRSFRGSGAGVEVVRFDPGAGPGGAAGAALELLIRPDATPPAKPPTPGPLFTLRFLDDAGREVFGGVSPAPQDSTSARRVTVQFSGGRAPARLQYTGLKLAHVEVRFEFSNVPLP